MISTCTFHPHFRLSPLPPTLVVVLALVSLVGLTLASPLQPGTSLPKEKRSDLVCGAASWEDVAAFSLLNYVAHAATVRQFPGDNMKTQIWYIACALFVPFAGVWRACESIAYARPFANALDQAKWAGALCMVAYDGERLDHVTELPRCQIVGKNPPRTNGNVFVSGRVWLEDIILVWRSRLVNKEREHIHGNYSGNKFVRIVPPNVKVRTDCRTTHNFRLSSSYPVLKSAAALIQLAFACFTLYRTSGDQVENYGYTAFGFTVIPYAIMSLINLTANLLTPEYPTLFLVHSDAMDAENQNRKEFDAAVGTIVPENAPSANGYYDVPIRGATQINSQGGVRADIRIPET
jgi:hypothetical protein